MKTIKELKTKLNEFPDDYLVDFYSDENVDELSVSNPRGSITTIEEVIEI